MEKLRHFCVIKYLQKKTTKDIHMDMVVILVDDDAVLLIVQDWAAEFRSLEDDPKSERPTSSSTEKNIGKFHRMLMDDMRLTINQISNALS